MDLRWTNDTELTDLMKEHLFPAVVGDVMDAIGLDHQFLPADVRPIDPAMLLAGRAVPVLSRDVNRSRTKTDAAGQPFGLLMDALDDLRPHEVYLGTGGSLDYALWGELMSLRAQRLGAAGAVLNGYHRDTGGILEIDFPTFSKGAYAQDQGARGQVIAWRIPVMIGQVEVKPGDLLFGDRDGICVIPQAREREVLGLAWDKVRGENTVRNAIRDGMGAAEAFRKYGIL